MPKPTAVDRRARVQQRKVKSTASGPESAHPPTWIKPQLTRLVDEAPAGSDWLHEIEYDGYRMHARIDGGKIQPLTRTGLGWSHRSVVFALASKERFQLPLTITSIAPTHAACCGRGRSEYLDGDVDRIVGPLHRRGTAIAGGSLQSTDGETGRLRALLLNGAHAA